MKVDLIIIGAGASGLMCGLRASHLQASFLILEHSKAGQKIKISGGGRCNFTNLNATWENYISQNPKFCISALSQFTPYNFLELVEKNKIKYAEKKAGQLFCNKSSKDILDIFLSKLKSKIKENTKIKSVKKYNNQFEIETNNGKYFSENLVIATGGLSFSTLGATDFGYKIAKQFGHKIQETHPALNSFILLENSRFDGLQGLSLPVKISCAKKSFEDDLLFTHKGISGPAVLQISSYHNNAYSVIIDFSPKNNLFNFFKIAKKQNKKMQKTFNEIFPKKFAKYILEKFNLEKNTTEIKNSELKTLSEKLHNWKITSPKNSGYSSAEITKGGVDTNEISSQTMESKKVKGLYFIGEVLDVAGQLGGYNLQWAWSSGWVAGSTISRILSKGNNSS